jgi:ferric-dicitrate binding protein FerR (iron transport regulator)
MSQDRITYLLSKYFDGTASPAEVKEMLDGFTEGHLGETRQASIVEAFSDHLDLSPYDITPGPGVWERIVQLIRESMRPVMIPLRRVWLYATAASVLLLTAGAVYLFTGSSKQLADTVKATKIDVAPGTQKATLTLADGSVVELDKNGKGELAMQGATSIQAAKGEIAYINHTNVQTGAMPMNNTLTTPNGGEFKLVLPDGSKVWLNAASSLRFASQFTGSVREVELTGEAYFEIAPNKKMPFYVKTPTTKIEVLGTNFNVNAYREELKEKTTLLEGKIRVAPNKSDIRDPRSEILNPGQQAITVSDKLTVRQVDPESSVAWKSGYFSFENVTITDIMRQLSRWYNITVTYEGQPSSSTYMIRFPRGLSLSTALDILAKINVHTRIKDNRQIVVLP